MRKARRFAYANCTQLKSITATLAAAGAATSNVTCLGYHTNDGSAKWKRCGYCDIAEIGIYTRALTSAEVATLRDNLVAKHGVTLVAV